MESQGKESRAAPAFQVVPKSKGRVVVGAAAVVAVSSFAFLVFGPLADQRALALAGYTEPIGAKAPVGEDAPRKEASLSQIVSRELEDPGCGRAARMPRARQRPASSADCV
ncbi:MAG: hypothetical protein ABIQ06_10650 [Caldimonas sp.]